MTFIKGIASLGAAMLIGLSAPSAHAGYVVDLTQQGADVVASGSGAIDLTGLTFVGKGEATPQIEPSEGVTLTGSKVFEVDADVYTGLTETSFGSAAFAFATSGSGGIVGPFFDELWVPLGYISDSPLSSTATYDSQTLSSLGVTPGTHKWTWGPGTNQNFTLVIGAVVPEASTWAMMALGFAGLGFMGYQSAGRRRRTTATLDPEAPGRSALERMTRDTLSGYAEALER
jgi:hypothetical protein